MLHARWFISNYDVFNYRARLQLTIKTPSRASEIKLCSDYTVPWSFESHVELQLSMNFFRLTSGFGLLLFLCLYHFQLCHHRILRGGKASRLVLKSLFRCSSSMWRSLLDHLYLDRDWWWLPASTGFVVCHHVLGRCSLSWLLMFLTSCYVGMSGALSEIVKILVSPSFPKVFNDFLMVLCSFGEVVFTWNVWGI